MRDFHLWDCLVTISDHSSVSVSHHVKPCGYFLPMVQFAFSFLLRFLIATARCSPCFGLYWLWNPPSRCLSSTFVQQKLLPLGLLPPSLYMKSAIFFFFFWGGEFKCSFARWSGTSHLHYVVFTPLERTTCKIFIFAEIGQPVPGSIIHFAFIFHLLFTYCSGTVLHFLNTYWNSNRV